MYLGDMPHYDNVIRQTVRYVPVNDHTCNSSFPWEALSLAVHVDYTTVHNRLFNAYADACNYDCAMLSFNLRCSLTGQTFISPAPIACSIGTGKFRSGSFCSISMCCRNVLTQFTQLYRG